MKSCTKYFLPPHSNHVVSVNEEDRSQESGDANVSVSSDEDCQGLHIHHNKNDHLEQISTY